MDNEDQGKRARKICRKLCHKMLHDCDQILVDEKYFKLNGDNVNGNGFSYSTDPTTAFSRVKFQKKKTSEPKTRIWMSRSSKGASSVYVHRSKKAVC